MSTVVSRSGRIAPVCQNCGRRGAYSQPTAERGRVDLWKIGNGWSCAGYPDDFEHQDGTTGDIYTCPGCRMAKGGQR